MRPSRVVFLKLRDIAIGQPQPGEFRLFLKRRRIVEYTEEWWDEWLDSR